MKCNNVGIHSLKKTTKYYCQHRQDRSCTMIFATHKVHFIEVNHVP